MKRGADQTYFRLRHPYSGVPEPLVLNGWNSDVVLENKPNPVAQPFGSEFDPGVWYENGLEGYPKGLPANREIVNRLDPTVHYRLQPYTENNVLRLTDQAPTNALTFGKLEAYTKLYILSAANNERGKTGAFIIHYADGTRSGPRTLVSHSWYAIDFSGNLLPSIFEPVGRSSRNTELVYSGGEVGFSMYQTEVDLSVGPDAGKAIARLEFIKSPEEGTVTGIYAVSGIRIPTRP